MEFFTVHSNREKGHIQNRIRSELLCHAGKEARLVLGDREHEIEGRLARVVSGERESNLWGVFDGLVFWPFSIEDVQWVDGMEIAIGKVYGEA